MANFSASSLLKVTQLCPELQQVLNEAIKHFDFTVLSAYRGEKEQNILFEKGMSKRKFPESKHNKYPSLAVDIAPFSPGKIDWEDRERFTLLAGFILGVAAAKGIKLRWGGNWAMDTNVKGNAFDDLPHIELVQ